MMLNTNGNFYYRSLFLLAVAAAICLPRQQRRRRWHVEGRLQRDYYDDANNNSLDADLKDGPAAIIAESSRASTMEDGSSSSLLLYSSPAKEHAGGTAGVASRKSASEGGIIIANNNDNNRDTRIIEGSDGNDGSRMLASTFHWCKLSLRHTKVHSSFVPMHVLP